MPKVSSGDVIPIYKSLKEFEKNRPDTVDILKTDTDDRIYIVGTAHFSKKSQDDVSVVMRNTKPHGVLLELCPLRAHILKYNEEELLKEASYVNPSKVKEIVTEHGVSDGMFYISFLNMSARLAKQLSVAPGGECRRAVAEAEMIPDCKVMLGDRPINITMKRTMALMSSAQKMKLGFLFSSGAGKTKITPEVVESYKSRSAAPMETMKQAMPIIYQTFVMERDYILAHSLLLATKVLKALRESNNPVRVVGVVGMGHLPGINQFFGKTTNEQVKKYFVIPKPTTVSTNSSSVFSVLPPAVINNRFLRALLRIFR